MGARIDQAPMLVGHFKTIAIGAGYDRFAPAFGEAGQARKLVGDAVTEQQAARLQRVTSISVDGKIVERAAGRGGTRSDQPDRGVTSQLLTGKVQNVSRRPVIMAEQAVRMAGKAVARQAGVEHSDLAPRAAQLQGGGKAGKAAANDNNIIHGIKLRA